MGVFLEFVRSGDPGGADRGAEQSPRLQAAGEFAGGELGVAAGERGDWGAGEGLEAERFVEESPALLIEVKPGAIALAGVDHEVRGAARQVGGGLAEHAGGPGGVAAPVKAGGVANPFVAGAAPQVGGGGAKFEEGDFARVDVGEEPLIGVEPVAPLREEIDRLVDGAGVLDGVADPRREGLPGRFEAGLLDGGFGNHQSRAIQVVVEPALDASRAGLEHQPFALGRLDVEPDVEVRDLGDVRHGDMPQHEFPGGSGRGDGGERAAVVVVAGLGMRVAPVLEPLAFQAARGGHQSLVEIGEFASRIDDRHIKQVESPTVPAGPGRRGPVGDPLHLFAAFAAVLPEEEGIDQAAGFLPACAVVGMAAGLRHDGDVIDNFFGQQLAVLKTAGVGGAFDVHNPPAIAGMGPACAEPADSGGINREFGLGPDALTIEPTGGWRRRAWGRCRRFLIDVLGSRRDGQETESEQHEGGEPRQPSRRQPRGDTGRARSGHGLGRVARGTGSQRKLAAKGRWWQLDKGTRGAAHSAWRAEGS